MKLGTKPKNRPTEALWGICNTLQFLLNFLNNRVKSLQFAHFPFHLHYKSYKKNFQLPHAFFAFTLAELLMATLIISIIMVALAPVITRRAHDNVAITVNQKQGLEIFATPGIYSFDVPVGINTLFIQGSGGGGGGAGATYTNKSLTYSTAGEYTWTVPTGVNLINFTITGAGGGGGGGYGRAGEDECKYSLVIPNAADNGKDLCVVTNYMPGIQDGWTPVYEVGTVSTREDICWNPTETKNTAAGCHTTSFPSGSVHFTGGGCKKTICTSSGAANYCSAITGVWYNASWDEKKEWNQLHGISYRLLTIDEGKRLASWSNEGNNWKWLFGEGLDLAMHQYTSNYTGGVTIGNQRGAWCQTPKNYACNPYVLILQGGYLGIYSSYGTHALYDETPDFIRNGPRFGVTDYTAGQVRCVRELNNWYQYSGAGGNSGAKYTGKTNVLPGDKLTITVGAGGNGGGAGSRGSQGADTKIVHKRGSTIMGTYYVKGGLGGYGASSSANGSAIGNGTGSSQTTPSGMCYAQLRTSPTASLAGGSATCNGTISYSGASGSQYTGGSGGKVANTGTATVGGGVDAGEGSVSAVGYNATVHGFGGGGGTCARSVRNPANCSKGGSGAQGKIEITYSIALPGGGGGSGTRIGGDVTVSSETKLQEMALKVTEGDRLVVKIGAGGSGGVAGQTGTNGEATTIGDNDVIFLGGEGGKVGSGTTTGAGGNSGTVKPLDVQTDRSYQYGLGFSPTAKTKVSYTKAESFIGQKGKNGGLTTSGSTAMGGNWAYGFSGGSGGGPYGVRSNFVKPSVPCGGGMSAEYPSSGETVATYMCTTGAIKGSDSKSHDPANNEFGGSGGGGGGVTGTSTSYGEGGNGAPGFLRIRWNEAEQD